MISRWLHSSQGGRRPNGHEQPKRISAFRNVWLLQNRWQLVGVGSDLIRNYNFQSLRILQFQLHCRWKNINFKKFAVLQSLQSDWVWIANFTIDFSTSGESPLVICTQPIAIIVLLLNNPNYNHSPQYFLCRFILSGG